MLSGPQPLNSVLYSAPTRLPVFIQNVYGNETFGSTNFSYYNGVATPPGKGVPVQWVNKSDWSLPFNVSRNVVFTPNDPNEPSGLGTKFWGFMTLLVNFNAVWNGTDPSLASLAAKGYNYW